MQDLQKIYIQVYGNLQLAQNLQNSKQQESAKLRYVKIGDIAYVKSSHKYNCKYDGPFVAIEKFGPVNVILQRSQAPKAKKFKIHINHLWFTPPRRQHLIQDDDSTLNSSNSQHLNKSFDNSAASNQLKNSQKISSTTKEHTSNTITKSPNLINSFSFSIKKHPNLLRFLPRRT